MAGLLTQQHFYAHILEVWEQLSRQIEQMLERQGSLLASRLLKDPIGTSQKLHVDSKKALIYTCKALLIMRKV